jgi:outer membrane biogenesis lipoprotein LolB
MQLTNVVLLAIAALLSACATAAPRRANTSDAPSRAEVRDARVEHLAPHG